MECTVTWTGASGTRSHMGFVAETGSGHVLTMDGAPDAAKPENGGANLAPRPMETVLAGTGGCTAYDVVLILKRGRHDVRGCSVKLTTERAETDPKVFTKIHMHFTVTGKGIPAAAVERAIAMSHDKYCSASIMLGKTAAITTGFEVIEALIRLDQMRCATVVMTLAASFIRPFTGTGSSVAPALWASRAWRASSSFICATMAREAWSPGGRRSM